MRELDRRAADADTASPPERAATNGARRLVPRDESPCGDELMEPPRSVGVVGRGRLGRALAQALEAAGVSVRGPWSRGGPSSAAGRAQGSIADVIVLCVPDGEIERAAVAVAGLAPLVGHTSGATPLSALGPAARGGAAVFGLHPLQTFTGEEHDPPGRFRGAGCAIAGSSPAATAAARELARRLGMLPFEILDHQRAAYHAAASVASNFLVTLEQAAESIAGGAGLPPEEARRALVPLVRTTVENWATLGAERALTGPVARGDAATVARQRSAVEGIAPQLLPLFDALVEATRSLASRSGAGPIPPQPLAAGARS